jgi:RNA polymerase sigma-70 factor (ECF subfamily)
MPAEPDPRCDSESVYERFDAPLRRFVRSRVRDREAADDVVQEVYLRVHSRLHTVRDCARLPGWLYQIARNAIVDHYRGRRESVDLPETLSSPADPCEDDVQCELAAGLAPMIESLPERYRLALILTMEEGLTREELAGRLGVSVSGAKSRVQRARERLKQMLLECCHFELDRFGHVIGYEERCCCCEALRPKPPGSGAPG